MEMRQHTPDGFAAREPTAKKIHREALVSIGPHHEWSADGHDKLAAMGFPIWGVRDKWSGKWLGLWVLPNNRLKSAIAMLYLHLIEEYGGKFQTSHFLVCLVNNLPCRTAYSNND